MNEKINFIISLDELRKMRNQVIKTKPEELEKWIEVLFKENDKLEDRLRLIQKELDHLLSEEINTIELCENFMAKIQKEFSEKSSDFNSNLIRLRNLTIDFDIWKVMRDISKENLNKLEYFKKEITFNDRISRNKE